MVSLLNSQGTKNCRESFCLSILTIHTDDWSTFWHICWYHVYFFFCEIPKYVQTKNRLANSIEILWKWVSKPTEVTGDGECRLTQFHLIRNFLEWFKAKHLKGHQMIGLDLSTSAKLGVKWIILKWYYVINLILGTIWIILVFYCKFCAFKIVLFYIASFSFFIRK